MKKTLFILLFLPFIGFGQEKSFELGLLYGGSLNSLNGDSEFTKNTLQPNGGFLVQYNFNNHFSVKSKLLYHIKGGKKTIKDIFGAPTEFNQQLNFHYVTLPFLVQRSFGKNRWRFFCNTGFYLGYLIKLENIFDPELKPVEVPLSFTPKPSESFKKIDFGLMLGTGVSFQISERIKFFLESSLDYGLNNTFSIESEAVMLTQSIAGAIGLTYVFPIKKKTFNGDGILKCADYEKEKEKKKSKWRLVLYKDGKKIGKKSKKRNSRLFKKKQ